MPCQAEANDLLRPGQVACFVVIQYYLKSFSSLEEIHQCGNKPGCFVSLNENSLDLGARDDVSCAEKCGEVARWLIDKGANVNTPDAYGQTPLMGSVIHGDIRLIKLLLQKGADINPISRNGRTAFSIANSKGDPALVKLLQEAGAIK